MFGNFKFIPDAMEEPLTLCKPDADCEWGSAVRVGSDFIYVSQPDQNRVLVMQASGSWLPLQVKTMLYLKLIVHVVSCDVGSF